jgi:hypothetical protein
MQIPGISPAVFHLRNRTVILVLSPPIMILAFTRMLAGLRAGEPWLHWLAGFVLWLFLLILALRRRMVLTNEGLEYTEFLSTAYVPWAQVTRLVTRRTLGIWHVEGLEVWTQSPRPKDLFIDLAQFSRTWRQDPLGAILREKAPHLFQKSARAASTG